MLPYKEFTDEEIIKAVECCSEPCCVCDECPLYCVGVNCSSFELHRYALNLINHQNAEIESLKSELSNTRRKALLEAASKFAGHSNYHGDTILCKLICMAEGKDVGIAKPLDISEIKAEAIKEFAERLKNKIKTECNPYGKPTFDYDTSISIMRYIDNLLKEMVGD